jgi:hypothetical protein
MISNASSIRWLVAVTGKRRAIVLDLGKVQALGADSAGKNLIAHESLDAFPSAIEYGDIQLIAGACDILYPGPLLRLPQRASTLSTIGAWTTRTLFT